MNAMQATPGRDAPPAARVEKDRHGVCAECGQTRRNTVVCDACGALNRSPILFDPFALLGLAEAFEVDPAALNSAYRAIARRIHPDRFTNSADETRALASRLSADVNRAQDILVDPVRRADFLLVRAGGPTSAELREVPGNLLAETMALREEIETAKEAGDASALARHRAALAARRGDALVRIAAAAARLPAGDELEKAALRRELNAMKYYDNLLAELALNPLDRAG